MSMINLLTRLILAETDSSDQAISWVYKIIVEYLYLANGVTEY
jgi:hypothetical protein